MGWLARVRDIGDVLKAQLCKRSRWRRKGEGEQQGPALGATPIGIVMIARRCRHARPGSGGRRNGWRCGLDAAEPACRRWPEGAA